MSQYNIDKERFAELFAKFTGISARKINNFLKENNVRNLLEHPTSLDITPTQIEKIKQLKELHSLYGNLKEYDKDYKIISTKDAGRYFVEYFKDIKDKEIVACALLDNQNNIISTKIVFEGTVNEAPVYPREITKLALLYDAKSVILAHNHPGGSLTPSPADTDITQRITNALSTQSISVLDHIIVAGNYYVSFKERGYGGLKSTVNIIEESSIFSVKEKLNKLKLREKKQISKDQSKTINKRLMLNSIKYIY